MNLFADENVDAPIVDVLRSAGHQVDYARELDPGIDDHEARALANARRALSLTSDKDFGELVFRRRLIHAGVVLLRLAGLSLHRKSRIISEALAAHGDEMPGAFSLITPGHIRIRREINPACQAPPVVIECIPAAG
jgi:predicted nuclease of predicted toxin-antitoxin system